MIRQGEGVAAEVLEKLGADLDDVRNAVIQLLSGMPAGVFKVREPQKEPTAVVASCPTCGVPLERALAYRNVTAESVDEEGEPMSLLVAYCANCGRPFSTWPA
jgi:ATP-dependent Clp protease ATP-binding subunit ClpC